MSALTPVDVIGIGASHMAYSVELDKMVYLQKNKLFVKEQVMVPLQSTENKFCKVGPNKAVACNEIDLIK